MPGFSNFFALNQNNSTTKTYGTPMGPNTDGSKVYSAHFKPFYYQSTTAPSSVEQFRFTLGDIHYFEMIYTLSRPTSGPNTSASAYLYKYAATFPDTATSAANFATEGTRLLEVNGSPQISLSQGNILVGFDSSSSEIVIFTFSLQIGATMKGIYQYF